MIEIIPGLQQISNGSYEPVEFSNMNKLKLFKEYMANSYIGMISIKASHTQLEMGTLRLCELEHRIPVRISMDFQPLKA